MPLTYETNFRDSQGSDFMRFFWRPKTYPLRDSAARLSHLTYAAKKPHVFSAIILVRHCRLFFVQAAMPHRPDAFGAKRHSDKMVVYKAAEP
jgi:hypothetical protein